MQKNILLTPLFALAIAAIPSIAHADYWFECMAINVIEKSNRVSVHCSNTLIVNGDDVTYFDIPNTDDGQTARFVSMAATAVVSGQIFYVLSPSLGTTNVSGCLSTNCRTPSSWGLKNEN